MNGEENNRQKDGKYSVRSEKTGGGDMLPKDPAMLLSYVNTQLRDVYTNLDELCAALAVDKEHLISALAEIDYIYNEESRQFV